jgi:signal transduction histidine kinase
LRAANKKLAERTRELEALHAENNQLAGMVAHDLRNPLQVIDGYGKLMLNGLIGPISPAQTTALEAVTRNCAFMLTLVNDLLSISRLNSGALELDRAPTDIGRLVSENVALNRLLAAAKNIRIDTVIEDGLPPVSIDAFKIEQVLNNLVSNAIKFSHPDTVITVSVRRAHLEAVAVAVADQGQGIPEADLPRLFTPFGKTSVKSTGGEPSTGLGLAIARRIVEGHGGQVSVDSAPGRGSTFTITVPTAG